MGEVYLAEREDEFRKRAAVKLIRPGMASPEVVRRFVIERQTLAALNHPHIVRLVDGGATEEGLPYLVVDYVEGTPIDRYADEHKLSITERLRLFVEVCEAVHYAHQSLIVHCDLKPTNILVTAEGAPMLLDFGIAKLLDPTSMGITAQAAMTQQRAFTPDYASPEQLRGEPVTTTTDIYALGVVLYELLTGHSPYRTTPAGSLADWIRSVCETDAEAPSTAIQRVTATAAEGDRPAETVTPQTVSESREGDAQTLRRRLRGDLDAIVLKALRKEPRDRYGSVDQMAEDVRRHLTGRPVLARKSTAAYVARKFFERHKLMAAAAAVVLLTLGGGLASTLWEARVAARRFEDVRQLAHAFLFDVYDSIADVPGTTSARALIAGKGADYLDRLAGNSKGDVGLELELAQGYVKIGDVQGNPYGPNLGNRTKALESYNKALAIAQAVVARDARNQKALEVLAASHEGLATVLPFEGKAAEGLEHAQQSVKLRQEVLEMRPHSAQLKLELDHAYESEGDILGGNRGISLGRREEAAAVYQKALELVPELPAGDALASRATRAKAVLLTKLADLERAGNAPDAVQKYASALETAEALYQSNPHSAKDRGIVTALLNKLAYTEGTLGNRAGSLQHFQRAVEIDEAALAGDPNDEGARSGVIVTLKNLGDLYYYTLSLMPEALRCYRRAAELLELQVKGDPGNVAWRANLSEILTDIASGLVATNHVEEAKPYDVRGLALAKQVADRPGATGEQMYNYAWLAVTVDPADLRNPSAALPYAIKAVELSKNKDPLCLHVLSQAYSELGDYRRAVDVEEQALALFPPVEAGKPAPRNRGVVESSLEEYRKELAKRGR